MASRQRLLVCCIGTVFISRIFWVLSSGLHKLIKSNINTNPNLKFTHSVREYSRASENKAVESHKLGLKEFGVVFSSCRDDVRYYSNLFMKFNCSNSDFYIYEKCGRENIDIPELSDCLTVAFMESSEEDLGRAHEVYLHHITASWMQLNPKNIFLKAKENPSLYSLLVKLEPQMVNKISFMSLAASNRRGKSIYGLGKVAAEHFHELLQPLISHASGPSIMNAYIGFQSNFIVSASRIAMHSTNTYQYLHKLVTTRNKMCESHKCCACEALERFWSTLFACSEVYTKFHLSHQIKPTSNIIEPLVCADKNSSPVINLLPVPEGIGRDIRISTITVGVYLASLLHWDVLIPKRVMKNCTKGRNCFKKVRAFEDVYNQKYFINSIWENFNVKVRVDFVANYESIPLKNDPCPNAVCKSSLIEQLQKYSDLTLKGSYILEAPNLSGIRFSKKFHDLAFRKSLRMIHAAFLKVA